MRFPGHNDALKYVCSQGFAQTPLGELTALPRLHSWIKGGVLLRGGRGKRKEGKARGREGKEGKAFPQVKIYHYTGCILCLLKC